MEVFTVRDIVILLGACGAAAIWLMLREFGKNAQDSAVDQEPEDEGK